jgi:hypothetical protein
MQSGCRVRWRVSPAALWLVVSLAAATACDPVYTVCATVRDCSTGKSLGGVHMIAHLVESYAGDTDSTGSYCTGEMGSTPSSYSFEASKPGYQDESIDVRNGASHTDMCLAPLVCIPSASEACDCGGGVMGTRVCNDQGSGFDPCVSCGAAADAGPE